MPKYNLFMPRNLIDQCCGISSSFEYFSGDQVNVDMLYNYDDYIVNESDDEHDERIENNGDTNVSRLLTFPPVNEESNSANKDLTLQKLYETRSYIDPEEENCDHHVKISIAEESSTITESCPFVLPYEAMIQIATKGLPPALFFCTWKRIYSLARDGDSFSMMLRLVKDEKRSLLVVKTTLGEIFGGFVTSSWTTESNGSFYGSGQSMLYKISNQSLTTNKDTTNKNTIQVQVYKWSGLNHYIQICDSEKKSLGLGGGGEDGYFGLCIEGDLKRGTTGKCETFQNDPLTHDGREFFEILDVEIWGFHTWTI